MNKSPVRPLATASGYRAPTDVPDEADLGQADAPNAGRKVAIHHAVRDVLFLRPGNVARIAA